MIIPKKSRVDAQPNCEKYEKVALVDANIPIAEKVKIVGDKKPIENWWDLIRTDYSTEEFHESFINLYRTNLPKLGEIIMTGVCPNECLHCLYPYDYDKSNPELSLQDWKVVIDKLYYELAIKVFIHCGRILDNHGIETLGYIKNKFEDVQLGIINDGISLLPYIDHLSDIQPNWIDISVDGLERKHDLQRNASGQFRKTFKSLEMLKENNVSPKINLLTTVTSINISVIVDVIKFFNDKGFKNFFISPVIDFKPWKSNDSIKINDQEWVILFNDICEHLDKYNDTWIELACYEIDQIIPFIKSGTINWDSFSFSDESIYWDFSKGNNNFYINFEPFSLVGIKDCVVNPSGKIIFNKSVVTGQVKEEYMIGDAVKDNLKNIYQNLYNKRIFRNYQNEFYKEMSILRKEVKK